MSEKRCSGKMSSFFRGTRKFDDKTYRRHDWYTSKMVARVAADTLKVKGYLTRITLRPKSKSLGGYPLCNLYYLWKRKG